MSTEGGGIMREILFRGKRVDNGKWVYGNLIQRNIWGAVFPIIRAEDSGYGNFKEWEVIPETIGQYTGLDDKNGVKIFEGDILYHPIQGKRKVYYPFSERVASYGLRMIEGKVRMASTLSDGFLYEIIGNITDNPELLEGKE